MLLFDRALDLPQVIETDEGKLRQVLMNLIGNAIKFTEAGSVTLKVVVGEQEFGVRETTDAQFLTLHFAVSDTGPGIDPAELKTLFESFVQTETGRRSQQGTGLGLALSRKLVELMGGEIHVSSTLNQGTTFDFTIPVGRLSLTCRRHSRKSLGSRHSSNRPKFS